MIKEIDYSLNEEETRAELIDPQLKKCGWSTTNDVKVRREYCFTDGKILGAGKKGKPKKADYILFKIITKAHIPNIDLKSFLPNK